MEGKYIPSFIHVQLANYIYFQEFCAFRHFDDGELVMEYKMCLWLTNDLLLRHVPLKGVALSDSKTKKKKGKK